MAVRRILLQQAKIVSGGGGTPPVGPIFTEDFDWYVIPEFFLIFTEDWSGWP